MDICICMAESFCCPPETITILLISYMPIWGFPGGSVVKNLPAMQKTRVQSLVRKIPWGKEWLPTPVFLPGEWVIVHGVAKSQTQLSMHTHILQYKIKSFLKKHTSAE